VFEAGSGGRGNPRRSNRKAKEERMEELRQKGRPYRVEWRQ